MSSIPPLLMSWFKRASTAMSRACYTTARAIRARLLILLPRALRSQPFRFLLVSGRLIREAVPAGKLSPQSLERARLDSITHASHQPRQEAQVVDGRQA